MNVIMRWLFWSTISAGFIWAWGCDFEYNNPINNGSDSDNEDVDGGEDWDTNTDEDTDADTGTASDTSTGEEPSDTCPEEIAPGKTWTGFGFATNDPVGEGAGTSIGYLAQDDPIEPSLILEIRSFKNWGGPNSAGEYHVTSNIASPVTCSLCLTVVNNNDPYSENFHDLWLAPVVGSGIITITAIPSELDVTSAGERFAGSARLDMRQIDADTVTTIPDGCYYSAAEFSWDVILENIDD